MRATWSGKPPKITSRSMFGARFLAHHARETKLGKKVDPAKPPSKPLVFLLSFFFFKKKSIDFVLVIYCTYYIFTILTCLAICHGVRTRAGTASRRTLYFLTLTVRPHILPTTPTLKAVSVILRIFHDICAHFWGPMRTREGFIGANGSILFSGLSLRSGPECVLGVTVGNSMRETRFLSRLTVIRMKGLAVP